MRTVTIELESISPYSQSRQLEGTRPAKEAWEEYENRTWRDKAHVDEAGHLFIPQFAFKQAIDAASKYLGKIKGKGNETWSKRFTGGVMVMESITLNATKEDLQHVWINAHANGIRGSGKRVRRCFPVIPAWKGSLTVLVVDDEINEALFAQAWEYAGLVVGIGRFRPQSGGINGRFKVNAIKWK